MIRSSSVQRAAKTLVTSSAVLLVATSSFANVAERGDDARPTAAELEPLQRFVGDWQTETTFRRTGPPAREATTNGKATCQATLDGRYFEFRSETIPPGDSDLQVMTYDEAAHVYRQWVFSSDGYRHEATGVWDAKTSTMTWTGATDADPFVIEDHWTSADCLQWRLVRKDAAGKVIQTIEGIVRRVASTR